MLSLLILLFVGFVGSAFTVFVPHSIRLPIFVFCTNTLFILFVSSNIGPVGFAGLDIGFVFFRSPNATSRALTGCALNDHSLVRLMIDVDRVRSLVLHELLTLGTALDLLP